MGLLRTVDAASEPVTTAEAKAHCRVTIATDDALIDAYIKAARHVAENRLGRALITQTWELTLDRFPDAIELVYPPIIGVTTIKYLEPLAGVSTTLNALSYTVDVKSEPGWIVPAYGYDWPDTRGVINAVTVTYTAGWGAAADVPQPIKTWILLQVGHWYENREASVILPTGSVAMLPFVDALLDVYRVVRMGP
jgi:uncharacterized phiE125 gp8 family phage protein